MNKEQFNKEIKRFKSRNIPENRKEYIKSKVLDHVRNNPPIHVARESLFKKVTLIGVGIAVLFGGTAFAAEQSLPGDMLYPVKTRIVEPLIKTTKFSAEAKAAYETRLREKRAEEKQELAEKENTNKEETVRKEEDIETSTTTETTKEKDITNNSEIEINASTTVISEPLEEIVPPVEESEIEIDQVTEKEIEEEIDIEIDEPVSLPTPSVPGIN